MAPSGWAIRRVDELGSVRSGRQRSPHFKQGSIRPYLRVANVLDGFIDTSDVLEMNFTNEEFEEFQLKLGDVLLNEGQSLELVGRSAIYRGEPAECCFQNTLIRFRPGPDILPEYAQYLFQHLMYSGQFAAIASRTTSIAHLGASRFASMRVFVPSKVEQRAIVDVIATWDRAIRQIELLEANQLRLKNGIVQQVFVLQSRLPGFSENWQWLSAGEIFENASIRGRSSHTLLSVTQNEGVIPRNWLPGRVAMPSGDLSSYKLIEPGQFVISLRSFQGGLEHSDHSGIVSPAYTVLRPTRDISSRFYKHYFKSNDFVRRLAVAVVGIRDGKQISYADFCTIKLPYPSIDEQEELAQLCDTLNKQVDFRRHELTLIQAQKRALMQKLLTGEIRVPLNQEV